MLCQAGKKCVYVCSLRSPVLMYSCGSYQPVCDNVLIIYSCPCGSVMSDYAYISRYCPIHNESVYASNAVLYACGV